MGIKDARNYKHIVYPIIPQEIKKMRESGEEIKEEFKTSTKNMAINFGYKATNRNVMCCRTHDAGAMNLHIATSARETNNFMSCTTTNGIRDL